MTTLVDEVVCTVRSEAVARVFTNGRTLRLLMLFAPEARTIAQAARLAGVPLGRAFYHVARFVRLGLLVVEREQPRRGRPSRCYRTVAPAFLLPFSEIETPCTEGLADELRRQLADAVNRDSEAGVVFSADASGGISMRMAPISPPLRRPQLFEVWHTVCLDDAAAARLAEELSALLERYDDPLAVGRAYLVHAAMAPRRER